MQEIVYHTNFKLEDSYWWFVVKFQIIKNLIENYLELPEGAKILDVGSGTGGFAKSISEKYDVYCLDTSQVALSYCWKRGLTKLINKNLYEHEADKQKYDTITMLDVIEHIEDDLSAVISSYNLLVDGGYLVITVPAYQFLWSQHDEIHLHKRRYTRKQLETLLLKAGYHIKYSSYFNTLLFPLALLMRLIDKLFKPKRKKENPVEMVSPIVNKILTKIFLIEKRFLPKMRLPFGLSIVAVAEKVASK